MSKNENETRRLGVSQTDKNAWSVGADKGLHSPNIEAFRSNVRRAYAQFVRVPVSRLMWMTIIGSAFVGEPGDYTAEVAEAFLNIERKLVSRSRRRFPGLRIRGVHEIDLLTLSPHMGSHKLALLDALGVDVHGRLAVHDGDDRRDKHRILVPHLHAVIDLSGHEPKRVSDELRAEFPGNWRTLGKSLYQGRANATNLEALASYSTKMKVAYSDSLGDRVTKFHGLYEPEWCETICSTLQGVGLDNLLFRYGRI